MVEPSILVVTRSVPALLRHGETLLCPPSPSALARLRGRRFHVVAVEYGCGLSDEVIDLVSVLRIASTSVPTTEHRVAELESEVADLKRELAELRMVGGRHG